MSERIGMRWTVGAIVVLLLGGAVVLFGGVFESDEPKGADAPGAMPAGGDPELATADRPPPDALTDAGGQAPADGADAGALQAGTEQDDADAATVTAGGTPGGGGEAEDEAKPAVRKSPFGLPKRKPGSRILPGGGGPGPGGPTGHWTRFGPAPKPKGTAGIAVIVLDEDGQPFAGADVYLGPPDTAGVNGISFGDLRKIGQTGADGVLNADALPHGAAAVFGNFNNRLNGRFGLDGRHGVKTVLRAGGLAKATVRLPISTAKLGGVKGRVIGPEGQPVPASVAIGFAQMWTKHDGRFAIQGIPEGNGDLAVRATGFRSAVREVEVAAGKTTEVEVKLDYADEGTMRVEGVVVGPEDEPVAGANVYLMLEKARGTLRRAITDDQGRFRMERLPERVRTEASRLQASRVPQYASHVLHFEAGITDERVRLQLPVRYVEFVLRVLDADTGTPIRQLRATAERPESKRPVANLTHDHAQGHRKGMVEPGRHTVRIDALDHEDVELEVDVQPDADGRFTHEVRLQRVSPDSVQVALTIALTDAVTGAPIPQARIEVLETGDDGQALSRFEGRRPDGEYRMPVPSGNRRLVVTAEGYETHTAQLDLKPDEPEVSLEIALRPR